MVLDIAPCTGEVLPVSLATLDEVVANCEVPAPQTSEHRHGEGRRTLRRPALATPLPITRDQLCEEPNSLR